MKHCNYPGVTDYSYRIKWYVYISGDLFVLVFSTYPNEILLYEAFHPGFYCLRRYTFWSQHYRLKWTIISVVYNKSAGTL